MTEHPKQYKFFLDAKDFETPEAHRTGAQIKAFIPTIPAAYQLYLEEEGDTPDKQISDSETVSLEGKIKHFYAVPPATFGDR
jgi:hypothetical protein